MSKENLAFRGIPFQIKLSETAGAEIPKVVEVMRLGKFKDENGKPIAEIKKNHFDSFIKNFESKVRGIDIAIDYKHDSEDIAAAWFKKLMLSEDGETLLAEVDWTPKGTKVVGEKEFRYLSGDFTLDYVDNETGKNYGPTLLGAGLTNRPVIKHMKPVIQLSEETKEKGNNQMDEKDKMIEQLKAQLADALAKLEAANKDKEKAMGDYKQMAEKQQLAEKTAKFDKMLSEGKTVEAQREAFIKGDLEKFTELSQKLNLSEKGNGGQGGKDDPTVDTEDKVLKLAHKALDEKKSKTLGEAIRLVLAEPEHAELRKAYEKK